MRMMSTEGAAVPHLCRPFGPRFLITAYPELTLGAIHFRCSAPQILKDILPKKQKAERLLHGFMMSKSVAAFLAGLRLIIEIFLCTDTDIDWCDQI